MITEMITERTVQLSITDYSASREFLVTDDADPLGALGTLGIKEGAEHPFLTEWFIPEKA